MFNVKLSNLKERCEKAGMELIYSEHSGIATLSIHEKGEIEEKDKLYEYWEKEVTYDSDRESLIDEVNEDLRATKMEVTKLLPFLNKVRT